MESAHSSVISRLSCAQNAIQNGTPFCRCVCVGLHFRLFICPWAIFTEIVSKCLAEQRQRTNSAHLQQRETWLSAIPLIKFDFSIVLKCARALAIVNRCTVRKEANSSCALFASKMQLFIYLCAFVDELSNVNSSCRPFCIREIDTCVSDVSSLDCDRVVFGDVLWLLLKHKEMGTF